MSILVTVLRVISEKLQNNDPKTRIIWSHIVTSLVHLLGLENNIPESLHEKNGL